ncbi:MAG: twin-arginine translocase TatA/TatE family subunit [Chloroflexi bacterium]|nr:twin-arginine translocase TatA/TatE family subunit [Chloroflexota bacterium]
MDFGLLLVVVLIAAVVWRGPKTLPQLGRMFGEGIRAARRQARDDDEAGAPPTQGPGAR